MMTTFNSEQNDVHPKKLFDETKLGKMRLKNRFIRAAVGDLVANGTVTDNTVNRYTALAKGGVGTIITGFTLIDESEKNMNILSMYDDSFMDGCTRLTKAVHQNGSNILMQLVCVGSSYKSAQAPDGELLGASAVKNIRTGIVPKEMTIDDIQRIEKEFADAAVRAKKCGFDGVEIHACHGYLLHQFATSYYNHRTDRYGGNRENRYRLTIETYRKIRQAVGIDYQVWIKIHSEDNFDGGVTHDDSLYLCHELAKLGIDAIEVSGNFSAYRGKKAYFQDIADRIARETAVPVIVTGGNRVYEEMEKMMNETKISYVGMARPLISQPDLIHQFKKKQLFESRCVSCNRCLTSASLGKCIFNNHFNNEQL